MVLSWIAKSTTESFQIRAGNSYDYPEEFPKDIIDFTEKIDSLHKPISSKRNTTDRRFDLLQVTYISLFNNANISYNSTAIDLLILFNILGFKTSSVSIKGRIQIFVLCLRCQQEV